MQGITAIRFLALFVLFGLCSLCATSACTNSGAASAALGASCVSSGDCTSLCQPRPVWPRGFCTQPCHVDADCEAGAVCQGVCLFSCFDDQDCMFLGEDIGCRTVGGELVCATALIPDAGSQGAIGGVDAR